MLLHFDYCMEIFYTEPVGRCNYTIKCIPVSNQRQRITNLKMEMLPESRPEWGYDAHGNKYIFGCNQKNHTYFKYRISGDAECGISFSDSVTSENELMIHRHHHGLNEPGYKLKEYYEKLREGVGILNWDSMKPLDKALYIMNKPKNDLVYEKGCTDYNTSAEEAFELGRGVCQDYSHILISLLILSGCSARYVTGLILGEGESHAWVEVAEEGRWYGVDPTNNVRVFDSHIRIGSGRDARECELNRGIMHGGGNQSQKISVSVNKKTSFEAL